MESKTTRKSQSEFENAFDVFKCEGRSGRLGICIIILIPSLVITVPISFVTMILEAIIFDLPDSLTKLTRLYPDNFLVEIIEYASLKINPILSDTLDGWRITAYIVMLSSILSLIFSIICLFIPFSVKVNLSLDDEQKKKLNIIIESFKKIKPITKYEVTQILNQGTTKIDFAKFTTNGESAYFLPEGIAYGSDGSGNTFQLLKYNNLSVKQENIEVLENELPKGADAVSDRVGSVEVTEDNLPEGAKVIQSREEEIPIFGWTHENMDGSKDERHKDNPRIIDHHYVKKYVTYDEGTKYVTYIKTVLKINELKIELLGDYNFPS